jgi:hypothetical protein
VLERFLRSSGVTCAEQERTGTYVGGHSCEQVRTWYVLSRRSSVVLRRASLGFLCLSAPSVELAKVDRPHKDWQRGEATERLPWMLAHW